MSTEPSRSLGPGVREALGGAELVDVAHDRGIDLLRPTAEVDRALLHQRHPDTAPILDEADRLWWLAGRAPSPAVLASARADDGDEAIVIELGHAATTADGGHPMGPEALVQALAAALRQLHELPVEQCPHSADAASLRAVVDRRIEVGAVAVAADGPYAGRSPAELASIFDDLHGALADRPDPVFVHAALAPGRLWLDPGGVVTMLGWQWSGVGDRHIDLAAAAAMLTALHGPALVGPFFEAYGFDAVDLRRLDAHQLLAHLLS